MEMIVLVDENDNEIGTEEKLKAHQDGKLHRAFSIFVFNSEGKMLIQKRAKSKYHSASLWTNACCSHPRPGESLEEAAHRRLKEEMGFDCVLEKAFDFVYKADFGNGITEWEFDHAFVGEFNGKPKANPNEVCEWKWISINELKKDIKEVPKKYTPWFKIAIDRVIDFYNKTKLVL